MSDKSKEKRMIPKFPQVDLILRQPDLEELSKTVDRKYLTYLVRLEIQALKDQFFSKKNGADIDVSEKKISQAVVRKADEFFNCGLRRVINGTGVILNTNLGRSPLPLPVLNNMVDVARGYSSLEIDVKTGKRGERTKKLSELLRMLTGCEAAIVVNNNASAVLLVVKALACQKEVVVSRSELIEIGGSFRLPDVIESAGGILKEVGTTNKTRARDFEAAISDNTGMFLRCHRSNFEIVGFTEDASMEELVKIAKKADIPLVDDLGSGAFYDVSKLGLKKEPTVKEVIESGVDVVTFSGDKLLGGPQAGVIAGSKELITRIRKNPIYRALRADKLILSLIENTLALYLSPGFEKNIPMIALAMVSQKEIEERIQKFINQLPESVKSELKLKIITTQSTLGGGSLPGETLESSGLEIAHPNLSANKVASILRSNNPPVISTIQKEVVVIDFRTILERDEESLREALSSICK